MRAIFLSLIALLFVACSAPKAAPDFDRAVKGHDKALDRLDRE